ncbi:hypothetical protein MN0502_13480 [Arthrobacter sp. MN05-02]|nr:hypothetical protein MN0502_13480 [Arthrobacter sp. MN05-02]
MVATPTRPGGRKPSVRPARTKETGRPASSAGVGPAHTATPSGSAAAKARTIKSGAPTADTATTGSTDRARTGLRARLQRGWVLLEGSDRAPTGSSYYLILGSALALTAIGLMMVLSASSVEAISEGKDSFDLFLKQAMWAGAGLLLMLVLSRLGPRAYRALAWPSLGIAVVLLVLVLVIGVEINGNKNWDPDRQPDLPAVRTDEARHRPVVRRRPRAEEGTDPGLEARHDPGAALRRAPDRPRPDRR